MPLSPGSRIGSFEITDHLGKGGMGEVYRAKDAKLKREVALKVLPAAVATDRHRLARFQREAEVLAALNHPHIAQIHGVEESQGTIALVMELVDGEDLARRLARGALPIDEALAIARQLADALQAAHGAGIIHRDLKPANIKLRSDGVVKVLDFGLAKALDSTEVARQVTDNRADAPTVTSPLVTMQGAILGTAAYMSPEQALGKPVDKRADVWAMGCVLYEVLTGRTAFRGKTVSETLASVLADDPDWSALPAVLHPAIARMLRRCLERDLSKRISDVATVRFCLEEAPSLTTNVNPANAAPQRLSVVRSAGLTMAGAAVAALAVAAASGFFRPATADKTFTLSILPPDGTQFAGTSGGPPAVSPDGRQVAFVAVGAAGPMLFVQSIDAFDARPLPGTEGASAPFWSPDGGWLGFRAGPDLKKVSVTGGQPQVLARTTSTALGAPAATWNAAGHILFHGGTNNTLGRVPAAGGETVQATERNIALFDEQHLSPSFLPDGQHYLLLVRGGTDLQFQLWLGQLGSNERRMLAKDVTNAHFAPPRSGGSAHVLYVREGRLMAHPFEMTRMMLTGSAVVIAENVAVSGSGGLSDFSVSPSGVLAYRRGESADHELGSYDRAGKLLGSIGNRPGSPRNNLRVSPGGKWVAFTRQNQTSQDVWIADLATGVESRFTLDGGRSPVWSPDGSQVGFLRQDTVYRKPFGSGGSEVAVWRGPGTLALNDWSGDGRQLLLTRWDTSQPALTGRGLWLLPNPLDETASHEPSLFQPDALHGQFGPRRGSPRWVAFDAFDGTTRQVFVKTMPGGVDGKWQITANGGNTSRWRADGRELFILSGGSMMLVADVEAGEAFQHGRLRPLFATPLAFGIASGQYAPGWDITPDGQSLLTTFPAPDSPAPAITVIINWERLLSR